MLAKACNHEGIVAIGTYRELAKTRGNTQIKPATCAVSVSFTDIPINTPTQVSAIPNNIINAIPAITGPTPFSNLNPMALPTIIIKHDQDGVADRIGQNTPREEGRTCHW